MNQIWQGVEKILTSQKRIQTNMKMTNVRMKHLKNDVESKFTKKNDFRKEDGKVANFLTKRIYNQKQT